MDVKITKLDNGLRVATSVLPHVESVSMGVWVGTGGRHESSRLTGVSHFLEHLLFKGTPSRSAHQISQEVEGRGGYLNAFTQEESTCYYARVPFNHTWRTLEVLTDMFLNASLRARDIQKERGVIVEEIMMYRDQPQHEVYEMLTRAMWLGHPLGLSILGTPETLSGMDKAAISAFKEQRYTGANTVFAFAGRVEHDACVAHVAALAGAMPKGRRWSARPVTEAVGQDAALFDARDIEQTHLAMGIRLFGRHDVRRHTLRVLSAVLGENMSSRLFQIVRERLGLAYSIQSSSQLFNETGSMSICSGLDAKNLPRAVELVMRELRRLREKPVPKAELNRAKEYLIGQLRLGLESTSSQMMWLGDNLLSFGRCIPPAETIAAVQRVTSEGVQELAQDIFQAQRMSIAVVSPELSDSAIEQVRSVTRGL